MNAGLILAGLAVGLLVGLTGMGAGSLMTPILISVFGIPAGTAVGTDLVYAAVTKTFGAARHTQLRNVNPQLALWMATGSVPAAFAGTFTLYNLLGSNINSWLPDVIGYALILVGIAVAVRTFVTIRGLWDASKIPTDGELTRNHKVLALTIGAVFGFILGITSVGSGVFFGMALILLFPLSARRVVGTDLYHGALVTIPAAVASYFLLPHLDLLNVFYLMLGSTPGILIGSQVAAALPERALRGSLATVLAVSALKTLGAF
jgi:uncharacterized protein